MTVLIYVDMSKQVGDPDHLKVFANADAAEAWFAENERREGMYLWAKFSPHSTRSLPVSFPGVVQVKIKLQIRQDGSMHPPFCVVGLALASLIISTAQAHSRGFAWFFAHSKPHGTCSGQHIVATFYSSGRRTASGQTFDPSAYTAAHRTLPFGSRVTVTNPQNGNSVTVVINDRGPFTHGVTLDLSRGAARAIGMHRTQWLCMV